MGERCGRIGGGHRTAAVDLAHERVHQSLPLQAVIGKARLVVEPLFVHLLIEPRRDAKHLVGSRADHYVAAHRVHHVHTVDPPAIVEQLFRVNSTTFETGISNINYQYTQLVVQELIVPELPGTCHERIGLRSERAHWADVDHVAAEFAREQALDVRADLHVAATPCGAQVGHSSDLTREPTRSNVAMKSQRICVQVSECIPNAARALDATCHDRLD